jgi:hypothetical protein
MKLNLAVANAVQSGRWGRELDGVEKQLRQQRRDLYWISQDLAERGFREIMEPDAQGMAELRNYIEHRFVRVVTRYGPTGIGVQDLLYTVTVGDLQRRALSVVRLAREALMMLVSAVYVEERRKGPGRGPWTTLTRLKKYSRPLNT